MTADARTEALLAAAVVIYGYRHDWWETGRADGLDADALRYAARALDAAGDDLACPSPQTLRATAEAIYPYRHNGEDHGDRVLGPGWDCWRYADAALAAAADAMRGAVA